MVDAAPVLDLIDGFRRSKVMFAALALGVFDGARPSSAGMDRLLDACVSLGLLERHDGEYRNTPVADSYLTEHGAGTLAGYVRYTNTALYRLWGDLEGAVLEGTNRWQQSGHKQNFDAFWREADERTRRDFIIGMHGIGLLSSPAVVEAFDLTPFRRLVDLGGATGHLALAARRRYPTLHATLFDRPEVIEVARNYVGDSIELLAGNFFSDRLPPADLFALGRILHNQTDEASLWLLSRVRAALPRGGAIMLAERLVDDDRCGPVAAHMQSLNMLVCAEGRERSLAEYESLLRRAGFKDVQGKVTGKPLDAVFAIA